MKETILSLGLLLSMCFFYRSQCAQGRCPSLAAQEGDPDALDISHFRAYIDPRDIPGLQLNASVLGSQVNALDLVSNGEVTSLFTTASRVMTLASIYPDLVLPGGLSPIPIHMQLDKTALQEVYFLFNIWSMDDNVAPPGCPTRQWRLSPGQELVNDVYLSCEGAGGIVTMQACLTLGTAPFDTLNGTYTTVEFYFPRRCEEASSAVCSVKAQNDVVPGEVCITLNQTQELVTNPVGSWALLPAALSQEDKVNDYRGYCVVEDNVGLVNILADTTLQPMFPIAERFSELDMFVGLVSNTAAVSFSMAFTSNNVSVLEPPFVVPITKGTVYEVTDISLQLPCLQPGVVEVPGVINLSSVMDDTLYFHSYTFSMYRDCTPTDLDTNSTVPSKTSDAHVRLLAGLIPGLMFVTVSVIVVVVMGLLTRRIFRKEMTISKLQQLREMENLSGNNAYMLKTAETAFEFLREYDMEYNYPSLEVVSELGEGAFGRVFKARAPGLKRGNITPEFVAVKTLKDSNMLEAFCKEVRAAVRFDHPSIVRLLAVCSASSEKCMIFEYMDLGSLDNLLRKSDPENEALDQQERESSILIAPSEFLQCSLQVAAGVAYLAEQKHVHRDIATRNCLVDRNLVVKIGDFGLSREVSAMDYYRVGGTQACLPIRWMPPEALLFGKFTTQSDVWSFGILMWEIYTYGHQPYKGMTNHEVIDAIKGSEILECPKLCPASVYDVMKVCWTRSPAKRPNMDVVLARLERLQLEGREERETGGDDGTASGCVCYVNMEYGTQVDTEELEESVRVEIDMNKHSSPVDDVSTGDQFVVTVEDGETNAQGGERETEDTDLIVTDHELEDRASTSSADQTKQDDRVHKQ